MSTQAKLSATEYLDLERLSKTKHEFINSEIFAMAGASEAHNLIVMNIGASLHSQAKKRPYRVYPSDLRVQVLDGYVYPDVTIVCGKPEFVGKDNLTNPNLIIEVSSPATEDYDFGGKFARYRQLESLQDYIIVSQDKIMVTHYTRQDAKHWLLTELTDAQATISLNHLQCHLLLEDMYDKVFE
ncbi:Uma2 family endonuclease [Candidatus Albibeggiatoa sp. nov. BB20]|uniref:Uma2 family endonuclease n=1 Tax=Candidatus Albibeggiatoa sp. nov. BB20 TaxID=3162723 RepID=UPI003365A7A0